jgi:hypothetical protein
MREITVEDALTNGVEAIGGECYKWTSPGCKGVPDRIVLLPSADRFGIGPPRMIFVETKAPDGVLKSWQTRCHQRLRELGFRVEVLWTIEQVKRFLCNL